MTLGRLALALSLSGVSSLLQEVTWNRAWVLVFGSSSASTASVLAVFMLGLGLGGRYWGLLARCTGLRGRRLLAALELGIAASIPLVHGMLALADRVHLAAVGSLGVEHPGLQVLRLVMAGVILLPPTFLMGATLPAAAGELEVGAQAEAQVGWLYAANTFGAVTGIVVGAYYLLPHIGLVGTLATAGTMSVASAAVATIGVHPSSWDDQEEILTPPPAAP